MRKFLTLSVALVAAMLVFGGSAINAQDKAKDKKQESYERYKKQTINYGLQTWAQSNQGNQNQYFLYPQDKKSPYWIGVQCVPAGNVAILSNIPNVGQLFKRGGLRVNSVTKGSVAEKAGVKKGDVILTFNKKQLNQVADLTLAITSAKTATCKLQVVRGGKVMNISLNPEKRPQEKKLKDGSYGLKDFRPIRFSNVEDCPADVEVTMQRKGKQQPVLIVKRGKKQWTVRNGKVDALPKDIRVYVLRVHNAAKQQTVTSWNMDGATFRPSAGAYYRWKPNVFYAPNAYKMAYDKVVFDGAAYDKAKKAKDVDVMKSLKELTKKVEDLQRSVKELKRRR